MINESLELIGRGALTNPEDHVKIIEVEECPGVSVMSDAFSAIERSGYPVTDVWMSTETLVMIKKDWNVQTSETNTLFGADVHLEDGLDGNIVFGSGSPDDEELDGVHYCIVQRQES